VWGEENVIVGEEWMRVDEMERLQEEWGARCEVSDVESLRCQAGALSRAPSLYASRLDCKNDESP
jgi:hypothetical protein